MRTLLVSISIVLLWCPLWGEMAGRRISARAQYTLALVGVTVLCVLALTGQLPAWATEGKE